MARAQACCIPACWLLARKSRPQGGLGLTHNCSEPDFFVLHPCGAPCKNHHQTENRLGTSPGIRDRWKLSPTASNRQDGRHRLSRYPADSQVHSQPPAWPQADGGVSLPIRPPKLPLWPGDRRATNCYGSAVTASHRAVKHSGASVGGLEEELAAELLLIDGKSD